MINSSIEVLPATSDNATLYLSMQSVSAGRTTSVLSATALTYNPSSRTLTLNGIDGTARRLLTTASSLATIEVVTALPASPVATTLYIVTG